MASMSLTNLSQYGNIRDIIRRANRHYAELAASLRTTIRPTHHARKHARALQLTVCIQAAAKLDQKQISTIPLPVLDLTPSPVPVDHTCINWVVVAPIPLHHSHSSSFRQVEGQVRPKRPLHRCNTDELSVQRPLQRPEVAPPGSAMRIVERTATVSQLEFHSGGLDEEAFSSLRPRVAVTGSSSSRINLPPLQQIMTRDTSSERPPKLDVPLDIGRFSWHCDMDSSPMSDSSNSGAILMVCCLIELQPCFFFHVLTILTGRTSTQTSDIFQEEMSCGRQAML